MAASRRPLFPIRDCRMTPLMSSRPGTQTEEEDMFYDTDCGGVVHNTTYLRYVERARSHLLAEMGMDLEAMQVSQLYAAVVRTEIDYLRPARLGDRVEVRAELGELVRSRFWCEFELSAVEAPSPLVKCRQCLVLVQMPEGRPRRLPDDWTKRWGADQASRKPG